MSPAPLPCHRPQPTAAAARRACRSTQHHAPLRSAPPTGAAAARTAPLRITALGAASRRERTLALNATLALRNPHPPLFLQATCKRSAETFTNDTKRRVATLGVSKRQKAPATKENKRQNQRQPKGRGAPLRGAKGFHTFRALRGARTLANP